MCTLGFSGEGYSETFIANYQQIADTLKTNPETLIAVVDTDDHICDKCPHLRIDKKCTTQEKIDRLDRTHKEALGIRTGEVVSWKNALETIKKNMSIEKFHQACAGCEWKKSGVCEKALVQLLKAPINDDKQTVDNEKRGSF
jgi:hypothetical protein